MKYLSIVIFTVIFILFTYNVLQTNFWSVELYQFWYSDPQIKFSEIWEKRWKIDYHLPTYHIITWTWFKLTNYSVLFTHIYLIFLFSIVYIILTYSIFFKKLKDDQIYFFLIWIILPSTIFHALEFRVYFFITFLSLIYFFKISKLIENKSKNLITFSNVLLVILISLLHYWGVILIFSVGIFLFLFKRKELEFKKIFIFHLIPSIIFLIFLIPKIQTILCCQIDNPFEYQKMYTLVPAVKVFLYSIGWKSKFFIYSFFLLILINISILIYKKKNISQGKNSIFIFSIVTLLIGFSTAYIIEFYLHIWKPYTAIVFAPYVLYICFYFINNEYIKFNFIILVLLSIYFGPFFQKYNTNDWYKPAKAIMEMNNCNESYVFSSIEFSDKQPSEYFVNFYFNNKIKIFDFNDSENFRSNIELIKQSSCNAVLYAPHTNENHINKILPRIKNYIQNAKIIEIEKDSSYIIIKE